MGTFIVGLNAFLHYDMATSLWGQGVEWSGLKKNGPHRLIFECLVIREWHYLELGELALLDKVCDWVRL